MNADATPALPILTQVAPGLDALAEKLTAICARQEFRVSFTMLENATGRRISRNGAIRTAAASTRKTLFMAAALNAVHDGWLSLDLPVTVTEELTTGPVSGLMCFMTPGLTLPLRDAIVQMIIISDNVCTSLVGDRVGLDAINTYAGRVGMTDTQIREIVPPRHIPEWSDFDFVAETTPDDQVHLLTLLLAGNADTKTAARIGLTPTLCQFALSVLGWQRYRERLPGLLPTGTRVANKTGTGRNGSMDAGIVFRDDTPVFTMAAYTQDMPWEISDGTPGHVQASRTIAELSRACWDDL